MSLFPLFHHKLAATVWTKPMENMHWKVIMN